MKRRLFNSAAGPAPEPEPEIDIEANQAVEGNQDNRGQCHHCETLHKEVYRLREERDFYKEKLSKLSMSTENFIVAENDPASQIKHKQKFFSFYFGLPSFSVFLWILNLITPFISERRVISKENQLLLTLMKLRHGLAHLDLAHRFGVSSACVSNVINELIPVLANRLQFLISWPSAEVLRKNMPQKFKKRFKKCVVIIDCTEFFIDRPFNLRARAQTWSNYKHHNTLKALIGITPYGSISFISKMWGGRISDKEISGKSGFYSYINPGNQVMADRGFLIGDDLARHGATLVMPPFLKGRKQLPGRDVERARQLSALRIHVERAIERVKIFKILKNTLPLTLVPLASDILTVCCALSNLRPKLIK